jgi:hypothetical protein
LAIVAPVALMGGANTAPAPLLATTSTRSSVVIYRLPVALEYLFGAPGVGRSLATCAPLACDRVSAPVSVMPLPEI